jgi:phage tail sheath protein FI
MLGQDRGIRTRSGIHMLKSFTEFADLVVVPQASQILSAGEHRAFYQRLVEEIGQLQHYFFIMDFLKHQSAQEISQHWKGFHSPDCAAYAPWVLYKGQAFAPGMSVAAAIQLNDAENGLSDLPANRALKGRPTPLYTLHPREVRRLQDMRVNAFQQMGADDVRIWGGLTMADPCDNDFKFLTTRRALLAVKEAVEEICAPFVMEPLQEDSLPSRVEASLSSIFSRVNKLFDPDAKTPFAFKVGVSPMDDEDVLVVDMKYHVPYALNEVSMSLGVNA